MRARTHTRTFFRKRDKKLDKCGVFVYIKIEEFYKRGTGFFIVPFFVNAPCATARHFL